MLEIEEVSTEIKGRFHLWLLIIFYFFLIFFVCARRIFPVQQFFGSVRFLLSINCRITNPDSQELTVSFRLKYLLVTVICNHGMAGFLTYFNVCCDFVNSVHGYS